MLLHIFQVAGAISHPHSSNLLEVFNILGLNFQKKLFEVGLNTSSSINFLRTVGYVEKTITVRIIIVQRRHCAHVGWKFTENKVGSIKTHQFKDL